MTRQLLLLAVLAACSDPVSHVFTGRPYVAARDCVQATTSIDVVDGPQGTTPCDRICLVAPASTTDAGAPIFVSTTCAPYPRSYDTSGTSQLCALALAAYDRNDTCLADGGSAHPPPLTDAAPE